MEALRLLVPKMITLCGVGTLAWRSHWGDFFPGAPKANLMERHAPRGPARDDRGPRIASVSILTSRHGV